MKILSNPSEYPTTYFRAEKTHNDFEDFFNVNYQPT